MPNKKSNKKDYFYIIEKHIKSGDCQLNACGKDNIPSEKDIKSFEKRIGYSLPNDFKDFSMTWLGGLYVAAKEEIWPRAKAYDVAPFWTFLYGGYMSSSEDYNILLQKRKNAVEKYIGDNGFFSIMNNTKWIELINGIHCLEFPPAYCTKDILSNKNPQIVPKPTYWGDWELALLYPFFGIEWMEIAPYYYKHKGNMVEDEFIDETKEVLEILDRNSIPYELCGKNIRIYGYKKSGE